MGLINLNERQDQVVFNDGDCAHVIPLALIRAIANGSIEPDRLQAQLLARLLLDSLG